MYKREYGHSKLLKEKKSSQVWFRGYQIYLWSENERKYVASLITSKCFY